MHQSNLDADRLIVQCALQFVIEEVKCVVADDTDVLVLLHGALLHGAPEHNKYIFSFRGWETFEHWKIDDIIGHIGPIVTS